MDIGKLQHVRGVLKVGFGHATSMQRAEGVKRKLTVQLKFKGGSYGVQPLFIVPAPSSIQPTASSHPPRTPTPNDRPMRTEGASQAHHFQALRFTCHRRCTKSHCLAFLLAQRQQNLPTAVGSPAGTQARIFLMHRRPGETSFPDCVSRYGTRFRFPSQPGPWPSVAYRVGLSASNAPMPRLRVLQELPLR